MTETRWGISAQRTEEAREAAAMIGAKYHCLDERDGYVLESRDQGWRAIFGHFTPSLQPPDVIPRQVQCLRWLLASQEKRLDHVRLAVSDSACGTFTSWR